MLCLEAEFRGYEMCFDVILGRMFIVDILGCLGGRFEGCLQCMIDFGKFYGCKLGLRNWSNEN